MLGHAAALCVIIFSNDMGVATSRAIINHERGHCACPEWSHVSVGEGKAFPVPKQCQFYNGQLVKRGYPKQEAKRRCDGAIGCAFPSE